MDESEVGHQVRARSLARRLRVGTAAWALLLAAGCAATVASPPPAVDTRAATVSWTTPRDWNEAPAGRLVRSDHEPVAASPSASGFSLEAEVALLSRYVWRGQLLTDDPVMQPAVTIGRDGWSFTAWANVDLTDVNDQAWAFSEVDLSVEREQTFETDPGLSLFAGAVVYAFPSTSTNATWEIYAGLELDAPLTPRITLSHDVAEVDGVYISMDAKHETPLGPGALLLSAAAGWGDKRWNRFSWGVDHGAFNDLQLRAAWSVEAGCWTVTPSVAYSMLIDERVRDAAARDGSWILGLTVGLSR